MNAEVEKQMRAAWADIAIAETGYVLALRGLIALNEKFLQSDEYAAGMLRSVLMRWIEDSNARGSLAQSVADDLAGQRYGRGDNFNRELFLADVERLRQEAEQREAKERKN